MICKGYAKAKNKFWKLYDANKPASCIIYIDGNNLYGPSLMQHLPTEIPDLVNPKDFNLDNYYSDSLINCFGEVALDYPDEGHDMHTD